MKDRTTQRFVTKEEAHSSENDSVKSPRLVSIATGVSNCEQYGER